ncbi:conserved Plasmodium protein, unknown function [Plasmodium malariae]|uniref:Uncharacterized protein n=1 Tax=Plasmodium malariae TaxID=5858 RepID=A0A1C3KYL3_PLAMA|nr:conserved Plasmodium protein, unknown function [Plasmodium malariae]
MLENLCIDLLKELYLAKYNFLLYLQLNNLPKREKGVSNKKGKEKRGYSSKGNLFLKCCTTTIHEKENYYLKFGRVKKKQRTKKRKRKKTFKGLRKHTMNMYKHYYKQLNGNKNKKNFYDELLYEHTDYNSSVECYNKTFLSLLLKYKKGNFILNKKCRTSIKNVNYVRNNDKKAERLKKGVSLCNYHDIKKEERCNYQFGKVPNGGNDDGKYDDGKYDDGKYDDGKYDDDKYDNGKYDNGKYDDSKYHDNDDIHLLNNHLCKYICKDMYTFMPHYNFEKNPSTNSNSLNDILNNEKIAHILKKRKEIKGKVYIKNKKIIRLSSKKLNKHYINFFKKLHSFLNKIKIEKKKKKDNTTYGQNANSQLLKTLLYLKKGSSTANGRNDDGHGRNIDTSTSSSTDSSTFSKANNITVSQNVYNSNTIKRKHYKLCEAISMITYLKKSLYVIKMDVMYMFIFFTSYINRICAKLKKAY